MDLKIIFLSALIYLVNNYYQLTMCATESVTRITYLSTEHPQVTWFDPTFYKNFTLISRRISRKDPRYFIDLYVHSLVLVDDNIKVDFYFYQFLTNRYRPSFIEMHFKFCKMVNSDTFFGTVIKQALQNISCPFLPGEYYLRNMSLSFVPKGFPFTKGRIYSNISNANGGVSKVVASGYIDMEVKVARINVNNKNKL